MGRLVILSGPSCVGKGPLYAALRRFYPTWADRLDRLVLYDSRAPRPGETDGVDYHFRSRSFIEALRRAGHEPSAEMIDWVVRGVAAARLISPLRPLSRRDLGGGVRGVVGQ